MDAVTYPDPQVIRFLDETFACTRIDITSDTSKTLDAMDHYSVVWTPTLIVCTPDGKEIRRIVGFTPPEELVPDLKLALAQIMLARKDNAGAYDTLERLAGEHPNSRISPEAMYWRGMAGYKRDGKPNLLMEHWKELKARYPESDWWHKASFIDG